MQSLRVKISMQSLVVHNGQLNDFGRENLLENKMSIQGIVGLILKIFLCPGEIWWKVLHCC